MDFRKLISDESAKLHELHMAIHRTVVHRDRNVHSHREWHEACRAFHEYVSEMDGYIERACVERQYNDGAMLEFVICFLEVNAWFFRSGYLKQIFLARLKRSILDAKAKQRLTQVLVDSVNRRGTREFRDYCRVAVKLATPELIAELEMARSGDDRARASRAAMMLTYIYKHSGSDHEQSKQRIVPSSENGLLRRGRVR